jgi:DNA-binding NtrC family response regulator
MTETMIPDSPLLLVDDEASWLQSLAFTLEFAEGINHVLACRDSRQVMDILARQEVSLVLLDINMPHLTGDEILPRIVSEHPEVPVIMLSGLNQVETAVKCMKVGAFDYFVKTVEEERLIAGIRRALAHRELQRECRSLRTSLMEKGLKHPAAFAGIVTRSAKMQNIFRYIEAVAQSSEPIMVTGESGAGKELIARAIHDVSRPGRPWMAVNVAGLDDHVFSDTLFGHVRGAFTGADRPRGGMIEKAASGTLFLDEIGDLSPTSQVKLLRLLQEGEYFPVGSDTPRRLHARVVVATNVDLGARQESGGFRKDLYYRLCAHHIHLPALRERAEDIPLLLDHMLEVAAGALGKKKPTPPPELEVLLSTYHFPGNIRELRGMAFDAASRHGGGKISMEAFKAAMGLNREEPQPRDPGAFPLPDGEIAFGERLPTLSESAGILLEEALRRARGNQSIAAGLLGISQQALSKRLKKSSPPGPGNR